MKVALIFGTRPEAIKIASLYHELKRNNVDTIVISTGQHKEMLEQVLDLFNIKVDFNLKIMRENQSLSELTSRLIIELDNIIQKQNIDIILVQGDTTSALVGALVGFYNKISIGHIEAGLRTNNLYSPFPEEGNRKLISSLATIHFAPTYENVKNLLSEGYDKNKIKLVGNTVIDSLIWIRENKKGDLKKIRQKYNLDNKKYILLTLHRRENLGLPMENILKGIKRYLKEKEDLYLVLPMHLNPKVREVIKKELNDLKNKILIEPLEYLDFISLMEESEYIMTDSGGIQEEAPTLGKPTLVLRNTTERPEAIIAGTAVLVGVDSNNIYDYMKKLEGELYDKMSHRENPYGDGKTASKIMHILYEEIGK